MLKPKSNQETWPTTFIQVDGRPAKFSYVLAITLAVILMTAAVPSNAGNHLTKLKKCSTYPKAQIPIFPECEEICTFRGLDLYFKNAFLQKQSNTHLLPKLREFFKNLFWSFYPIQSGHFFI